VLAVTKTLLDIIDPECKTKLMPKKSGFTLIELMVVISIIAILATVGISTYTNAQKTARDSRRMQNIQEIAKALEVNKASNAVAYSALLDTMFASGTTPLDSNNGSAKYCVAYKVSLGSTSPAVPTAWANTSACPTLATPPWAGTAPVSPWSVDGAGEVSGTAGNSIPPATATSWTVCTLLELGTAPNNVYCKKSQQ